MITIYKKEGELLSSLVVRARTEYQISSEESVTYAGRLDPMASGVMILLVGKEEIAKEKASILQLPKVYEFEILLDVSTDTHDVLGIIDAKHSLEMNKKELHEDMIRSAIAKYNHCTYSQQYPHFSSKPVDGKPLFMWAKDGVEKELPSHDVTIFNLEMLKMRTMIGVDVAENAIMRVQNIRGDFRQEEIIDSWKTFAEKNTDQIYTIVKMRAEVSSGTYIRVLASDIARDLGAYALAFSIMRTSVGTYVHPTPQVC